MDTVTNNENYIEEFAPGDRTVVLLKPDALEYKPRLQTFLDNQGLKIIDEKNLMIDEQTLERFYPHARRSIQKYSSTAEEASQWMQRLIDYFKSGQTLAFLIEGPDALNIILRLKTRLRRLLHLKKPCDGLHSSDSPDEAAREQAVLGLGSNPNTTPY